MRMLNSKLYRKSAIQHNVPYVLTIKFYWKSLIGTAGAWFLYDFVAFANGACKFLSYHLRTLFEVDLKKL